jgi:hypothetical protein
MMLMAATGKELSFGASDVFEEASVDSVSVAMLTSTKAIVCYRDTGNSNYGTACILDISESTITSGSPEVFESANSDYISVAALSSTKAIVCYRDTGNSNYGTACILDVSVSTITPGSPEVFESAATTFISVAMLTSTKAIVSYSDGGNSSYGTACILDVSVSTITPGSPEVFESADTDATSIAMLTSTKAIVCYKDVGNSNYGTACILDVSVSTITPGSPEVFESAASDYISVAMLTSTKAIVCYRGVSNYGSACILDVSVSTITPGAVTAFEDEATTQISVAMLTSTKAIVSYRNNSATGMACILNESASAISYGVAAAFEPGNVGVTSVAMLTSTKAVVCYVDVGNSSYGTSKIIMIGA